VKSEESDPLVRGTFGVGRGETPLPFLVVPLRDLWTLGRATSNKCFETPRRLPFTSRVYRRKVRAEREAVGEFEGA
jgi:hypothetical protein